MSDRASITVTGVVNGMGQPDSNGSYIHFVVTRHDPPKRMDFRMSLGGSEVLADEINILLGRHPS